MSRKREWRSRSPYARAPCSACSSPGAGYTRIRPSYAGFISTSYPHSTVRCGFQMKEAPGISPEASSWRVMGALDVAVEHELPGVRPKRDRVDLFLALVLDPGVDDVLGENPAFEQERVVLLQGVERLRERARHRLDLRLFLALELVDVLVDRLWGKDLVLDAVESGHQAG